MERVPFLMTAALFLAGLLCLPTSAMAKKCPPGQYGVFKGIKCPLNTYAYKDHILTKLGCKKCPTGTYSPGGVRKCSDKPCSDGLGGAALVVKSGAYHCNMTTGKRRKCYRGAFKSAGSCRSCRGKDHHGYNRNFRHNHKKCERSYYYTCKDGSWKKGASCKKVWKPCFARTGLSKTNHGKTTCHSTSRYIYKCNDGTWQKQGPCPKRKCDRNGSKYSHGAVMCWESRNKRKYSYTCEDGTWKKNARRCR